MKALKTFFLTTTKEREGSSTYGVEYVSSNKEKAVKRERCLEYPAETPLQINTERGSGGRGLMSEKGVRIKIVDTPKQKKG